MLLAGCGAVPFDYHPATEMAPGPGMFTGERGAIVIKIGAPEERKSPP